MSTLSGTTPTRGPLETALAARDCDACVRAIAGGADPNEPFADGLTPLCRAAALGERRILKLLLSAHVDVDAVPKPNAAPPNSSSVADHVVDAGFAALHWACRENKLECVRMLIDASATVDVRASDDVTPFMIACKGGHHECAKLLHRAGAQVDAANARGGTAMVVACVMGESDTVRLLLGMGADADAVTVALDDTEQLFQCRPLVTACRYNQPTVVSLLLSAGVSVEATETALTELEAFPGFKECHKLVKRAVERKQHRKRGGARTAATAPTADAAAEARAEAAMAELLAAEDSKSAAATSKGKSAKGGAAHAKGKATSECIETSSSSSSLSSASSTTSMTAGTTVTEEATPHELPSASASGKKKARRKAKKVGAVEAAKGEEEEEAARADADAEDVVVEGTGGASAAAGAGASLGAPAVSRADERVVGGHARRNMHALISEYKQYNPGTPTRAVAPASPRLTVATPEDVASAGPTRRESLESDSDQSGTASPTNAKANTPRTCGDANTPPDSPTREDDANNAKDFEQLDRILCRSASVNESLEELDLFLEKKKFTTSAMTFFLTKIRRPLPPPPLDESVMRKRKAKRAPPPPGLLVERVEDASWVVVEPRRRRAPLDFSAAAEPPGSPESGSSPADAETSSGSNSDAADSPLRKKAESRAHSLKRTGSHEGLLALEKRLERELVAACGREAELEAELKQRSVALSELVVCPITHEPMVDPVSAADGQTYERVAIEEWLEKGAAQGGMTSPLTGEPLKDRTLRPNFLARALRAQQQK